MEEFSGINPNLPEVEIIYRLLKASHKQARQFRELLEEALAIKGLPLDNPHKFAEIHTEMILDHRFTSLGRGSWGLKEWTLGKVVRRAVANVSVQNCLPRHRSLLLEFGKGEDVGKQYDNYDFVEKDEWE